MSRGETFFRKMLCKQPAMLSAFVSYVFRHVLSRYSVQTADRLKEGPSGLVRCWANRAASLHRGTHSPGLWSSAGAMEHRASSRDRAVCFGVCALAQQTAGQSNRPVGGGGRLLGDKVVGKLKFVDFGQQSVVGVLSGKCASILTWGLKIHLVLNWVDPGDRLMCTYRETEKENTLSMMKDDL